MINAIKKAPPKGDAYIKSYLLLYNSKPKYFNTSPDNLTVLCVLRASEFDETPDSDALAIEVTHPQSESPATSL